MDKKQDQKHSEKQILVTADVIGLYPSIPHVAGLEDLKNAIDARQNISIPTENFLKMADFVLKNNVFEFNGTVKEQTSGTAVETKCAPSYPLVFICQGI